MKLSFKLGLKPKQMQEIKTRKEVVELFYY